MSRRTSSGSPKKRLPKASATERPSREVRARARRSESEFAMVLHRCDGTLLLEGGNPFGGIGREAGDQLGAEFGGRDDGIDHELGGEAVEVDVLLVGGALLGDPA